MTGRAVGRSRGRGRGASGDQPRPGAPQNGAPTATGRSSGGRGRSRGAPPPQQQQAAAPPAQQQPRAQAPADARPPTQQMQQMQVKSGEERPPRRFEQVTTRPTDFDKRGSGGNPCRLLSNYFKLVEGPKFEGLFQYNVAFEPEVQSRGFKNFLLKQHVNVFGQVRCWDGMVLIIPVKLPDQVTTLVSTRDDGSTVTLTVRLTNEVPKDSPQTYQVLNIVFKRMMGILGLKQIQRQYYNEKASIAIPQFKISLLPGYSTSIAMMENNIMLNVDVVHKVLREETVLQMMYDLNNKVKNEVFHEAALKKLVGEIVLTRYNNKTYRVDDIAWDQNPQSTFTDHKSGEQISFVQYYEKIHDKKITDLSQPMLVSNPKKRDIRSGITGPILLLPEFCVVTGLSEDMKSNFNLKKEMQASTRVDPAGRVQSLHKFMGTIYDNPDAKAQMDQWNMSFEKNIVQIEGRTLPCEEIFQRGKAYSYKQQDADWSRDLRSSQLMSTSNIMKWVMIFSRRDSQVAGNFLQTLIRVCGPMGIKVDQPQIVELPNDSPQSFTKALKDHCIPGTQLALCIVPNNRKDRYDAIKKFTCVQQPVPSQVVVSRTISKPNMLMSVATKIGIQLNCKLGGEVWALKIPPKKLMVVGIDVYHDSLTKGKSIGGFVASTNPSLTRYYSRITEQQTGLEMVDGLKTCMTAALKKYNEENQCLPDTIVIFRDGVGMGQLDMVREHELPQMIDAINSVSAGGPPIKLALVIVTKRISTRFFASNGNNLANPLPGTIVDQVVTNKRWYDYFLVSQSVRQGTVAPTHFNVIHDTTGWKPANMQKLTYKLTHLYYNWPGTIRVPAPCQYAHKLAFLVGQSVHESPSIALADRLYYL